MQKHLRCGLARCSVCVSHGAGAGKGEVSRNERATADGGSASQHICPERTSGTHTHFTIDSIMASTAVFLQLYKCKHKQKTTPGFNKDYSSLPAVVIQMQQLL